MNEHKQMQGSQGPSPRGSSNENHKKTQAVLRWPEMEMLNTNLSKCFTSYITRR